MTYGTDSRRVLIIGSALCALVTSGASGLSPAAHTAADDRPADSLYRVGREALAHRDYQGAAELLARVAARYPTAEVAANAEFWRAYALYASGNASHSLRDLSDARAALDSEEAHFPRASSTRQAHDLRARVIAAEASLGDVIAKRALGDAETALAQPLSCDDGDVALKLVALERLIDRDPEDAMPTIKRVLSTQGSCMDEVRRTTITVVASTPGMDATAMAADLARADRALQPVQGAAPVAQAPAIPPIRPLGPLLAVTRESLASLSAIRVLSDGRVLVLDVATKRVVLFDSSLVHGTSVVDTTSGTARAYGASFGWLLPFAGDSSLFADNTSSSLLVLDPNGKVSRVIAAPSAPSPPAATLSYITRALVDVQGNLVELGAGPRGGPAGRPVAPGSTVGSVTMIQDSSPVLRVNIETKRVDTAAWAVSLPNYGLTTSGTVRGGGTALVAKPFATPFTAVDWWAVMPDGSLAVVRVHDYHIDWVAPNGIVTHSPKIAHEWVRLTDSMKTAILDSARRRLDSLDRGLQARRDSAARGTGRAGAPAASTVPWISPDQMTDYIPPIATTGADGGVHADADGNVWIHVRLPSAVPGGPVYDVVNRAGVLIDRIQLPGGTQLIGFGHGVAYLSSREGAGYTLARARIPARIPPG